MFRTALITLVVLLCGGLAVTVLEARRMEQSFTGAIDALREELSGMREALPTTTAESPRAVHGRLYLDAPARPVSGADVQLLDLQTLELVRRTTTDEQGEFRFANLPEGDYSVFTWLVDPDNVASYRWQGSTYPDAETASLVNTSYSRRNDRHGRAVWERMLGIQSRPLYLAGATHSAEIELDVAVRAGRIAVELPASLPDSIGEHDPDSGINRKLEFHLYPQLTPAALQRVPWSVEQPVPGVWPVRGYIMDAFGIAFRRNNDEGLQWGPPMSLPSAFTADSQTFLSFNYANSLIPTGDYELTISLRLVDPVSSSAVRGGFVGGGQFGQLTTGNEPANEIIQALSQQSRHSNSVSTGDSENARDDDVAHETDHSLDHLLPAPQRIAVKPGQDVLIRLHLPPNYLANIEAALSRETLDPEEIIRTCSPIQLAAEVIYDALLDSP